MSYDGLTRGDPAAHARAQLEEAMRVMFERWGEWRMATPEDAERVKLAVADAEARFLEARAAVERAARASTGAQPARAPARPATDLEHLRESLRSIERSLRVGDPPSDQVDALLLGHRHRTAEGQLIKSLERAVWRRAVGRGTRMWTLVDEHGRIVAKITRAEDPPSWTTSVWNEEKRALEPIRE